VWLLDSLWGLILQTLISAISLEKVVASVNIYGAVDAVTFEGFILKEVLPKIKFSIFHHKGTSL
jgi:hypothetical protein